MSSDQMRVFIGEALEELPPDIIRLLFRIVYFSQSGVE